MKGRHSVKFNVTYWEHRQVSAVAESDVVMLALEAYIAENVTDGDAERARVALAELGAGKEPSDMGIVTVALREYQFTAPEGTEPDQVDENTDYTAEVRRS
jgi:hypothetical protein